MIFEVFFFYVKRVIKHGRYRVLETYSVKYIWHIFNRFERVRRDVRWDSVTLIVDRVYGLMNSLFNNRYVQFFFLFLFILRKYFSTRILEVEFYLRFYWIERKLKYTIYVLGDFTNNLKFVKKNLRSFSLF